MDGGYELIAGERRWRAARRVGLQMIPALVRETDDATSLQHTLVENLHRDGLNPLEEAAAYQQLIEDFGLTHEAVASQVGKSRTSVTNSLRLLQLPPSIQKLVHEGRLNMGQARALLATPDRTFQEQLARRVVQDDLSVRAVEDAIREHEGQPSTSPAKRSSEPKAQRSGLRPPGLLELEELLGDHLETRVTITMGSARGKVVVEFSTLEDLERIYRLMTEGRRGPHAEVAHASVHTSLVEVGGLLDAAADPHHDGIARRRLPAVTSRRVAATSSWAAGSHSTAAMRVSRSAVWRRPQTLVSTCSTAWSSALTTVATRKPASERNRAEA